MSINDLNRFKKIYPFYRQPGVTPVFTCCDLSITSVKTSNYSAGYDEYVSVNPTSGGFTVTLPNAAFKPMKAVFIKNVSSSNNNVTIASAGGTIDGTSTTTMGASYASMGFISDGTNWQMFYDSARASIPGSNNNVLTSNGAGGAVGETNLNFTGTRLEITGSLSQGATSVKATGTNSHAEGSFTTASGQYSHAEGTDTTASGDWSHSEGATTTASGDYSHAEGATTTASGDYSHAEGTFTTASGYTSHAEGNNTTASGHYSHAEGIGSKTATGANGAHASGYYVIASGSNIGQNVVGKYNLRGNSTSLFVVGNGSGDDNASRSDILRVESGSLGNHRIEVTGSVRATMGFSGSLTSLVDGSPYLIAGSNVTLSTGSNGAITISSTGGGGGGSIPGSDNQLLTSNGAGSANAESNLTFDGSNLTVNGNATITGDLTVNGATSTINTVNLEVKDSVIGLGFSSGTIALSAGDRGWIGGISGADNVMHKWDNANSEFAFARTTSSATGSFGISNYANVKAGIIRANSGFSGSLTSLVDGSPYLFAGTNVTLSTGSNGAITIAVPIPGSNNNILTSNGAGGVVGETNLNFTGTRLEITGALTQGPGTMAVNGSHAEGTATWASNTGTHAEGYYALAFGGYSHAEGGYSETHGDYSHVEGYYTKTYGYYSHAEGGWEDGIDFFNGGTANGHGSHAEGINTFSNGNSSHAEGIGSETAAGADGAHASGYYVIASGSNIGQNVVGKYNLRGNSTSLFVVGNGSGDTNSQRSDILRVESGSLGNHRIEVTGSVHATMGFSGSLTTLTDGTPYLFAGTNVTLSTGSNGAITISSTGGGGGGSIPGSDNQLLTSNGAGSANAESNLTFDGLTLAITGSVLPGTDATHNLGSPSKRWANVYTGDLHLKNDRGDWTLIEEEDCLTVRNNVTGKRYKISMTPID